MTFQHFVANAVIVLRFVVDIAPQDTHNQTNSRPDPLYLWFTWVGAYWAIAWLTVHGSGSDRVVNAHSVPQGHHEAGDCAADGAHHRSFPGAVQVAPGWKASCNTHNLINYNPTNCGDGRRWAKRGVRWANCALFFEAIYAVKRDAWHVYRKRRSLLNRDGKTSERFSIISLVEWVIWPGLLRGKPSNREVLWGKLCTFVQFVKGSFYYSIGWSQLRAFPHPKMTSQS
jgi:hypothetical protein